MATIPAKAKRHAIGGWRGYYEFENSVRCTGYSGERDDSPNPKMAEIKIALGTIKQALRKNKIKHRVVGSNTSNVFTSGFDVLVEMADKQKARELIDVLPLAI